MTAIATRLGGIHWTHPKTVGIFGIALGILAFWLALPPGGAVDERTKEQRCHTHAERRVSS